MSTKLIRLFLVVAVLGWTAPAHATSATPSSGSVLGSSLGQSQSDPLSSVVVSPPGGASYAPGIFALLVVLILAISVWRTRPVREFLQARWRRMAVRLEPHAQTAQRVLPQRHGLDEPKQRGLSHHRHSGKVLAHHHTSYPALAFMLLLATVLTAAVSVTSQAADSELSLTVLGPPPTVGATIDQPLDGEVFTISTQTVRGTCPVGLMVEIYRNGVFAGSTNCDSGGLYNLVITLVPGSNALVARDLDGLGQYGPDSATVTVTYNPPPPTPTPTPPPATPTPTATPGGPATTTPKPTPRPRITPTPVPTPGTLEPFYIETGSHFFQGASPEETVIWEARAHGGTPRFVTTWTWGDGHQDSAFAPGGKFTGTHKYAKPGTYKITVRAIDASGREAVMSLVAVINGGESSAYVRPIEPPGNLIYIWPLIILASLMVLSFWLGERHKLAVLGTKPAATH